MYLESDRSVQVCVAFVVRLFKYQSIKGGGEIINDIYDL